MDITPKIMAYIPWVGKCWIRCIWQKLDINPEVDDLWVRPVPFKHRTSWNPPSNWRHIAWNMGELLDPDGQLTHFPIQRDMVLQRCFFLQMGMGENLTPSGLQICGPCVIETKQSLRYIQTNDLYVPINICVFSDSKCFVLDPNWLPDPGNWWKLCVCGPLCLPNEGPRFGVTQRSGTPKFQPVWIAKLKIIPFVDHHISCSLVHVIHQSGPPRNIH